MDCVEERKEGGFKLLSTESRRLVPHVNVLVDAEQIEVFDLKQDSNHIWPE